MAKLIDEITYGRSSTCVGLTTHLHAPIDDLRRDNEQLAQLEEERAALEAKIQKLEDPEATDDEPEILEQPLEQPPAAHEDEPAILEQGKPGDTKACPNCTYVCSQAFMCCPMCRHDFFFMDEDCAF